MGVDVGSLGGYVEGVVGICECVSRVVVCVLYLCGGEGAEGWRGVALSFLGGLGEGWGFGGKGLRFFLLSACF